jgi:serine/threonine protein kinase/dienelactone hydrolase
VAIKVLPEEVAGVQDRLERFEREAKLLASLNHPNIATLHGLEEEGSLCFLVMELVEGESLAGVLARGTIPVDEALPIALQIAKALETAHELGVVHRDLKPANLMVDSEGQVKVLDFGLAKAFDPEASSPMSADSIAESPTLTADMTRAGTVLGTAAYMSPEQASGEAVDHRTDIWALSVILYEMICGKTPFRGEMVRSVLSSILNKEPEALRNVDKNVPRQLERIVAKGLAKEPESRYADMTELHQDLRECLARVEKRSVYRALARPHFAVPAVFALVVLVVLGVLFFNRNAELNWARQEALPEAMQLVERGQFLEAFQLGNEIESLIPGDPYLDSLWRAASVQGLWRIEPPEVDIHLTPLSDPAGDWLYAGNTREAGLRIPNGMYRFRFEKEGFEPLEIALPSFALEFFKFRLDPAGSLPAGMVRIVAQGTRPIVLLDLWRYENLDFFTTPDFLMDKFEVSNRQFVEFVDAGGYERRELWARSFERDGEAIAWDEAMAAFRDKTGRPGPSMWEFGTYPEGQGDYPLTGVSWYEAEAYARFAGKRLPTLYHWQMAAAIRGAEIIIPGSNFGDDGLVPIGHFNGSLNAYGIFDMAGNAREWVSNASGESRFVLGGAWNDPGYFFTHPDLRPPFDRSPGNGFRCMRLIGTDGVAEELEQPISRASVPDWSRGANLPDEDFRMFVGAMAYERTDLRAEVELVDDSSAHWTLERVSFEAAYDGERMLAYLFLPKTARPPYQTLLYWPGALALDLTSSADGTELRHIRFVDYFVKDGRAVLYPLLKGTYERTDSLAGSLGRRGGHSKSGARDRFFKQVMDLRRSIDYLETRNDIDEDKLGYCGYSWGAYMGAVPAALDERIKVGVLISGGIAGPRAEDIVGLDDWELYAFATRVQIPILMLNGRYDSAFPYEESQLPFFRALSTPEDRKRHVVFEDAHHTLYPYRQELIRESLKWLDQFLGPVR